MSIIRRAENKDVEGVEALLSQVLEVHAALRPDLFLTGTRKYNTQELFEIFQNDSTPVFVMVEEERVLGYCFCVLEETKDNNVMPDMLTLYIDDLCVDQTIRGKHIGRSLYEYVLQYAKSIGCSHITLNVWEGNDTARIFYEKMGLEVRKTTMEKVL